MCWYIVSLGNPHSLHLKSYLDLDEYISSIISNNCFNDNNLTFCLILPTKTVSILLLFGELFYWFFSGELYLKLLENDSFLLIS